MSQANIIKLNEACSSLRLGAALYTHLFKSGLHSDPYIQSALIHMYSNYTNLAAARQVDAGFMATWMSERMWGNICSTFSQITMAVVKRDYESLMEWKNRAEDEMVSMSSSLQVLKQEMMLMREEKRRKANFMGTCYSSVLNRT